MSFKGNEITSRGDSSKQQDITLHLIMAPIIEFAPLKVFAPFLSEN